MDFLHVNGDGVVTGELGVNSNEISYCSHFCAVNPNQNEQVKDILKTFQKVSTKPIL